MSHYDQGNNLRATSEPTTSAGGGPLGVTVRHHGSGVAWSSSSNARRHGRQREFSAPLGRRRADRPGHSALRAVSPTRGPAMRMVSPAATAAGTAGPGGRLAGASTRVALRVPHDGRLACSARRSPCVLRTTVGIWGSVPG
jgi:hypothetical protein